MDVAAAGSSAGVGFDVTTASDRSGLSRGQFLNILVAEMQNQDPMEPMDNAQLLNQLMQMQQLESSSALTDGINGLLKFQTLGTASSMIGKTIEGIGDDGSTVIGVVDKVTMSGDDVRLFVDGQKVALNNVQAVISAEAVAA